MAQGLADWQVPVWASQLQCLHVGLYRIRRMRNLIQGTSEAEQVVYEGQLVRLMAVAPEFAYAGFPNLAAFACWMGMLERAIVRGFLALHDFGGSPG